MVRISQSRISRIETGHLVPPDDEVERLISALRVDASMADELRDQARAARTTMRSWRTLHARGFAQHQADIARWEQTATRIRLFQPNIIPGLCQTPKYARHAIELSTTDQDIPTAVAARMARQAMLSEPGKSFEFLITEGALRWRIAPIEDHVAQLDHVALLATWPNVSVGVLPWSARVAALPNTMFVLLDDASAYVELMNGEVTTQDRNDVAQYAALWSALSDAALTGEDAIGELRRIASELTGLA